MFLYIHAKHGILDEVSAVSMPILIILDENPDIGETSSRGWLKPHDLLYAHAKQAFREVSKLHYRQDSQP